MVKSYRSLEDLYCRVAWINIMKGSVHGYAKEQDQCDPVLTQVKEFKFSGVLHTYESYGVLEFAVSSGI